jgi:hypothetical protein
MAATETAPAIAPDRLWFARSVWPFARLAILGMLPCPDLPARLRMRRTAHSLVTLQDWPGKSATSQHAAQLAMLRLLWLQRQTRRAVRSRQREASVMLARASVETLLLGLFCLRDATAIVVLDAAALKGMGDALAFLEDTGVAPEAVIRECIARLGQPAKKHVQPWDMVAAIDAANGNKSARGIYRQFYVPLSNFSVHAGGASLMRHVGRRDRVSERPSRSWNRRSPARVADAAAAILAAALAQDAGKDPARLIAYADRHGQRALFPVAVMGLSSMPGALGPRRLLRTIREVRSGYDYLHHGAAAAESLTARTARIREQFASVLDFKGTGIPAGSLDPFIDYVADLLARSVDDPAEAGS